MSGIVRANNTGQSGLVANTETIDSDDYVDASIDNAHLADDAVNTDEITDDAVTADKLADAINTSIAANTAKTTNATHSGDVTGATALTIASDAVEGSMVHSNVVDGTTLEQSGTQFRIKDNGVSLAKMAGGTDGNLITYDTSGDPAFVATGDDGQVLTSAGADNPPTFETAAGVTDQGVKVTRSGTLAVAANVTATIAWDTETYDTNSLHDTSTNTERLTVPSGEGGKWLIIFHCEVNWVNGTVGHMYIRLNGSTDLSTAKFFYKTYNAISSHPDPSGSVAVLHDLDEDDYVEARFVNKTLVGIVMTTDSHFEMQRIA